MSFLKLPIHFSIQEKHRKVSNRSEMNEIPIAPDNPLRKPNARFLCHVRFRNELPSVPCDPKTLLPPLNSKNLAAFALTSMEKEMKRDIIFPQDLGLSINALDIERYSVAQTSSLDPSDEALIREDKIGASTRARVSAHNADVSWLLRTKYITSDAGAMKARSTPSLHARKDSEYADKDKENDLQSQINNIEESFEAARKPPKHPKNTSATPVSVLPVLPDEALGSRQFVLTNFDGDPIADLERTSKLDKENIAILEGSTHIKSFKIRTPEGKVQSFATYMVPRLLPSIENSSKDSSCVNIPAKYFYRDYDWVREYDTKVAAETDKQTYLIRIDKDHVGFSDLSTKLTLRKRARDVRAFDDSQHDAAFQRPEKFVLIEEDRIQNNDQSVDK